MSCKVIRFDNDYMFYFGSYHITDGDGVYVASLSPTLQELSLNPIEMTEAQIWILCKPIINAYELGIKKSQQRFKRQLLQLFNLKEHEE